MRKPSRSYGIVLFAPMVAIAILGAGCASSRHARQQEADRQLSALLAERLSDAPLLRTAKVLARSHWGVVALVGEVPDEESRREAERVAAGVAGVVRVDNLILVVKGDAKAEASAPAASALILARTD
jgi:BON domain-containing protein